MLLFDDMVPPIRESQLEQVREGHRAADVRVSVAKGEVLIYGVRQIKLEAGSTIHGAMVDIDPDLPVGTFVVTAQRPR